LGSGAAAWYSWNMQLVERTSQFHVYDDVLSDEDFRALWNYVQLETYAPVHQDSFVKVWRTTDGVPLGATTAVFYGKPKPGAGAAAADGGPKHGVAKLYPSHTAVDRVLATLAQHLDDFAELIGKQDVDFDRVSARSFLYPAGTALSWHADDVQYAGGYAFYTHPEWRPQWGGELLVADESTRSQDPGGGEIVSIAREGGALKATRIRIPPFLDSSRQDAVLSRRGLGRFISARPNRLVVIAGGNPHRVNPVSAAAGDHVRCSISGFFHRPA
jgi:hypothetical protein